MKGFFHCAGYVRNSMISEMWRFNVEPRGVFSYYACPNRAELTNQLRPRSEGITGTFNFLSNLFTLYRSSTLLFYPESKLWVFYGKGKT